MDRIGNEETTRSDNWSGVYVILVVAVIVGFCWGFAELMMWNDDRQTANFKQECIAKGGEYVDFEHDDYVASCDYKGHRYYE